MSPPIKMVDLFTLLPAEWPADPGTEIVRTVRSLREKVVILDDDATGTQTVYDVPVLTEWSIASLERELTNDLPAFFVLTNARSVSAAQAQELNFQIARNLGSAAVRAGRSFVVISRSDSTLRGHFPEEVDGLIEGLEYQPDGVLLIPFFSEGGRYTVADVHYFVENEHLIPVAESEFAKDSVFGYRHSNLLEWVEEKTRGRSPAHRVQSISLDLIRGGGPQAVFRRLLSLSGGAICVINAASPRDLKVVTKGLLDAEANGKRFICRTAASFPAIRSGLMERPLLTAKDFPFSETGGLLVVGSYVPKTTLQVKTLLAESDTSACELETVKLLDPTLSQAHIRQVASQTDDILRSGKDVVILTSRQLMLGSGSEESLAIGKRLSQCLVQLLHAISIRPRYILAKGGITSSDLATAGLGVKRAIVKGQILPGVSVWEIGSESRFPKLPYVVFPGNVGDARALLQVVRSLARENTLVGEV